MIVSLTDRGSRLVVQSGALIVQRAGEDHPLLLSQVDEVQLHGGAELTAAARGLLLRAGVDVSFFTADGRYTGRMSAAGSKTASRRFAWYRFVGDPGRKLAMARGIIAGKIHNQRAVLLVRQRRARDAAVADVLVGLRAMAPTVSAAASSEVLLGHEGAAAASYYGGLGRLVSNPDLPFAKRSRRPPKDGFNAALSYGYALLLSRVEHAIWRAGLDPGLGVLHSAERGAPALALDLMEELRPVVDDMVLTLVNRRQLHLEDFQHPAEDPDAGLDAAIDPEAVHLGRLGRSVLLQAWARALSVTHPHPTQDRRMPLELIIPELALQAAALCEGRAERWTSFRLET